MAHSMGLGTDRPTPDPAPLRVDWDRHAAFLADDAPTHLSELRDLLGLVPASAIPRPPRVPPPAADGDSDLGLRSDSNRHGDPTPSPDMPAIPGTGRELTPHIAAIPRPRTPPTSG